jgi:hypothetical protein
MHMDSNGPVPPANGNQALRDNADERRRNILRCLVSHGPATLEKLAIRLGEPEHRIRYAMRSLAADCLVHVCDWEPASRMHYEMRVPVYSVGAGTNIPAPIGTSARRFLAPSPLDYNPAKDLQRVTVMWGLASMQEMEDDQEQQGQAGLPE